MKIIHRIIRSAVVLAATAMAFAACAAGPALASPAPPAGGSQGAPAAPASIPLQVTGGMPGWEITIIAVAAALVAATLAVQADRMRGRRARVSATAG